MLPARHLFACLILAVGLVASAARAARPFPQATSDLAPDPAAHFGTLPNGLRYVILPHHEPKARLSLRLLVESGSFMEEENQRGLAHFLEHMAFKGSTHYAPGTLIEFFQRLGMSFGGDTNAYTSFDQTVYELELPDTKDATLREGLQVFADFAGGLLLQEKEIDSERGVILSEKRTRDNVDFRTFVAEANFVYAGTRLPARIPIGQTDIIEHAQRPLFVDLYNTWYRPERMTVVAVGDADAAVIEARLTAAFAGVTDRAPARTEPALGKIEPFQGLRVKYSPEPEAAATTVSLQVVAPYQLQPDTAFERRKYLPRDLAVAMLNRRLSELAKQENAGFSNARTDADESFNFIHEASLEVTCKPDQWQKALRVGEHELRRALTYGFEPAELKEATANFLNGLQQAVQTAATTPSPELAAAIVGSLVDRQVFTSPAEDLALFGPALAQVTPEDCVEALREAWGGTGRYLLVSGNVAMPGDAVAAITAAYEASRAEPVTAPAQIKTATFAYTHFGAPGAVVSRQEVKDLGLTLVTFANGVRLNLKSTDFEAGQIRLNVRVGTGQLTEPPAEPGLSFVADNTFIAGGLVRHSADDLRRILAGRTVGVGFNVGGDAFVLSGSTNREDLLLELQLITAHLTDPGYRPEALRQLQKGIGEMYNSFAHTPGGALNTAVPRLLAGGDPRFGLPDEAELLRRNLAEVKTWLAPQLARGAIEIGVVGDLDVDATIAAVARTLGALPAREPRPALEELRQVAQPAPPFTGAFTFASTIPKGVVALYWHTADARDVHRARRLNLLADVLSDRLRRKIRDELGGAYSPSAENASSEVYRDFGWMRSTITVDPAQAARMADVAIAQADDLATHGLTADELARAKLPALTFIRESARTNDYWLGAVVSQAQEKPAVLDRARSRLPDIEAVTPDELDALAREYLAAGRVFRVTILPGGK